MSTLEFGLVQSIFTLGGLIGALAAGPFSNNRGRLLSMRLNTIPTIIGPILSALAPSVALMSVGRLLSGIGAGAALVVVPIYISEIAPPESKGFYGSFTQIMTNVGILTTQVLGYFLSHDSMWRAILAVAGGIAVVQAIALVLALESPRWLAERGQAKQARDNLHKLRGTTEGIDDEVKALGIKSSSHSEHGDEEHSALLPPATDSPNNPPTKINGDQDQPHHLSFVAVLTSPRYRPAILTVILIMAAQQLTGINSIVMYGVGLLSSLLSSSSALLNIFVSLVNVVCTTAFAPLSDNPKLGRKGVLLLSIAGMSISSILLGIGISASIKVLSAVCVLLFVASFALGLGPVPFMIASEMVDGPGIGATQSWSLGANWIATFVVAQFFPVVNKALGNGVVYFVFCGLGVAFFVLIWRYVPETRGKKSMDEVWGFEVGQDVHQD